MLTEFYSHVLKLRELEEALADELQLLARKVINKKLDFWQNLDATLKQHYANHLYDHSNASIAKTLLLQMPKVTFTQFHNELARVLGTRQHPKSSFKAVSVSTMESESGDEAAPSKAQQKCKAKVSAQSSQIWDLNSKLDTAIMENCQIREFLNLGMLQTVVTNALQVVQSREHGQSDSSLYMK